MVCNWVNSCASSPHCFQHCSHHTKGDRCAPVTPLTPLAVSAIRNRAGFSSPRDTSTVNSAHPNTTGYNLLPQLHPRCSHTMKCSASSSHSPRKRLTQLTCAVASVERSRSADHGRVLVAFNSVLVTVAVSFAPLFLALSLRCPGHPLSVRRCFLQARSSAATRCTCSKVSSHARVPAPLVPAAIYPEVLEHRTPAVRSRLRLLLSARSPLSATKSATSVRRL